MNLILIPGFWLDGASWDEVAAPLRAAGHTVQQLTLPGLESQDADRSGITLRDHVDAVVAAIDASGEPVVLVGHSGGGPIAWGAADARPDLVTRVIYVDSGPQGEGEFINDELPSSNGEIPLPDWAVFDDADLIDLTDELRERFASIARPQPLRVATDKQHLSNEARYDVASTVICCQFTSEQLKKWMSGGAFGELASVKDYELVDLPTGHWPQFTRPADLAATILQAVDR